MLDDYIFPFIIFIVLFCFGFLVYFEVKNNFSALKELSKYGYLEGDMRVFRDRTGISYSDLLESPAARKQFESFLNGETTEFIKQAQMKKNKDDATATAAAFGMAAGLAAGSVSSR